jgi:cation:H+ antiporter
MLAASLQFAISAAVVVFGGIILTRCADAIADRTDLGRLLVGSVFLAAATSLPELSVDLSAVWNGMPDLAVGDLMGSSLFNLAILAALDLTRRAGGRMFSHMSAAHALSGAMSITLLALAAVGLQLRDGINMAGMDLVILAILGAYLLGLRLVYYDQQFAVRHAAGSAGEVLVPAGRLTLRSAIAGYVLSAAVIIVAAPFLTDAAGKLAEATGLGDTFVGTTLVALSTSLPELVATGTAVRMQAFDLAIGNIFGSNAFNMALLFPLDLAQPGSLMAAVSPTHAVTCTAAVLITAVAIMGQLYRSEKRRHLLEPGAALILVLVVAALVVVYYHR